MIISIDAQKLGTEENWSDLITRLPTKDPQLLH